jgi:type I restriction enzyme S subunit
MMSKKSPQLRFEGFTDDWEEHKLGDYIIQYSEKTKQNNQYPVFTSSRNGLFFQKDYYKGNQIASEDNIGYNIVPRGYFTYRHMSDDLVFKFNINDLADYGIVSTLYPVFTTNEQLNSKYLQYQLNEGSEFRRFSLLQKQGGSRTYMYLNKLQNMILNIPKLEEQQKIGSFFKQLDDTIALHQRKLDLLKEQKKGYLQKMFPKNGEKVPELRFAGFADDWELRKLGEIAKMYSGGTPSVGRKELYDGNIPFIRSAEINSHNTELFISELGLSNSSAKMVSEGTLLYALYGATSGEVGLSKISGAINQAILAIIPSIGYSSSFLLQWLKREKNNIIEKYLQGGQGNLSGAIVKDFFILFPSLPEQEDIGTFFSTLDRHITLHQRKLDLLKEQKKGFLQKMFV